jgi:hypothetical protein
VQNTRISQDRQTTYTGDNLDSWQRRARSDPPIPQLAAKAAELMAAKMVPIHLLALQAGRPALASFGLGAALDG